MASYVTTVIKHTCYVFKCKVEGAKTNTYKHLPITNTLLP